MQRRDPPSLYSTEKVAGIALRMMDAGIPVLEIEWILLNAKVLTEAGIEYTKNNRPALPHKRHHLRLVVPQPPANHPEEEKERVRELIRKTRQQAFGKYRQEDDEPE